MATCERGTGERGGKGKGQEVVCVIEGVPAGEVQKARSRKGAYLRKGRVTSSSSRAALSVTILRTLHPITLPTVLQLVTMVTFCFGTGPVATASLP